jgi:hypothetical protein
MVQLLLCRVESVCVIYVRTRVTAILTIQGGARLSKFSCGGSHHLSGCIDDCWSLSMYVAIQLITLTH